jgi:hypothetical protein
MNKYRLFSRFPSDNCDDNQTVSMQMKQVIKRSYYLGNQYLVYGLMKNRKQTNSMEKMCTGKELEFTESLKLNLAIRNNK